MTRTLAIITLLLSLGLTLAAATGKPDDIRRVQFDHKRMNIHLNLTFKAFESMKKMMPRSMKEEIANDYYPYLRKHLSNTDNLEYKDAKVSIEKHQGDVFTLSMEFPNYFLIFRNITWDDFEALYKTHFVPTE